MINPSGSNYPSVDRINMVPKVFELLRFDWNIIYCFTRCLFVRVRFYGPVNPMGSCRARSVYLTTHLLGRLSSLSGYCAHSLANNWQLPFLNQRKGENDRRKYFMINLHETRNLLISSRTRIQLRPALPDVVSPFCILTFASMCFILIFHLFHKCLFFFPWGHSWSIR